MLRYNVIFSLLNAVVSSKIKFADTKIDQSPERGLGPLQAKLESCWTDSPQDPGGERSWFLLMLLTLKYY